MNNSTVNFATTETSINSTIQSIRLMDILEISVYSISLLFGLPTHTYVIWLIVTGNRVASEFFNLNLSVCELGICLNSVVFVVSIWLASFSRFKFFLIGLSITGRPLFQCLICVERYLAVVHPVTFLKYKPLRYRMVCCTVVWIFILGSCLCCLFLIFSQYKHIHTWVFMMQIILVLSIQLFCLVAVLRALKQLGPGERKREEESHMKRRAFNIILITTVNMLILYLPKTITGVYVILSEHYTPTVWFTALICYVLAGFVQPILYLHRAGKLSCLCST